MSRTWLLCTACPVQVHCHSSPMSRLQPQLWTPGWDYLKEPSRNRQLTIECKILKDSCICKNIWIQFPSASNASVLTHTGVHFTPLIPFNCSHKRDQAFQSLSNSTQITLASAQLAKYTVVHLVSFGLHYSSQHPSWSTTDASIAVKFFHIKVFRSYPKHFTASNVCVCVFLFLRKIEGAEEGCRTQSICMQLHKGTV